MGRRAGSIVALAVLFVLGACGGSETVIVTVRDIDTVTETVVATETVTRTGPAARTEPTKRVPRGAVLTPSPRGGLFYRPTRIVFEDFESGYIADIRWTMYGGPTAVGRGIHRRTGVRARVTLRLRRLGRCGGKRVYTEWAFERATPNGRAAFSPIMSPHTWATYC